MLPPRTAKILIVEDDPMLADMLGMYFDKQGYRSLLTEEGLKALTLAADYRPDLVILDIHLPDIDGLEVCRRLHASHRTRDIPVIFLTEMDNQGDKLRGLELGVVDYITKPFDLQELRLRVRNVLRRAGARGTQNPITGMPDGKVVLEGLADAAEMGQGVVVLTLDGLDSFRELYGILNRDEVLRVTARMVSSVAAEFGGGGTFCGHLDETTFIITAAPSKLPALQGYLNERSAKSLDYFYPPSNRGRHAHTADRLRAEVGCIARIPVPVGEAAWVKGEALRRRKPQPG